MSTEVSLQVIKSTQDSLGKFIKKPPLSEKLLRKPPFRFLHDIVTAIINQTGFLDGLFSEQELISDNVKDRETKIAFLQKLIQVVNIVTESSLSVRPSKIIAGQEPEKTNELLQQIGIALQKNLSSAQAVQKVLAEKGNTQPAINKATKINSVTKPIKTNKGDGNTKTEKTKSFASVQKVGKEVSNEKLTRGKKIEVKKVQNQENVTKKTKAVPVISGSTRKHKEISEISDTENEAENNVSNSQLSSLENQLQTNTEHFSEQNLNIKANNEDEEIALKNGVNGISKKEQDVSDDLNSLTNEADPISDDAEFLKNELESKSEESRKEEAQNVSVRLPQSRPASGRRMRTPVVLNTEILSNAKKQELEGMKSTNVAQMAFGENLQEVAKENHVLPPQKAPEERESKKSSAKPVEQLQKATEEKESKKVKPTEQKATEEKENKKSSAKSMESRNSSSKSGAHAKVKPQPMKSLSLESKSEKDVSETRSSVASNGSESKTSSGRSTGHRLRPPSVRPSSARPGAPRLRERNTDVIVTTSEPVLVGKVNVIVENYDQPEEDEGNLVVMQVDIDDNTVTNNDPSSKEAAMTVGHGHLVQQILQTQQQLVSEDLSKVEIEWEWGARRERETALREVESVRLGLQALSRAANPLSRLAEHVQEDTEVMRQELARWRRDREQASRALTHQYSLTEQHIQPLQAKLDQLEKSIEEQTELLNTVKANVYRNSLKIRKIIDGDDAK